MRTGQKVTCLKNGDDNLSNGNLDADEYAPKRLTKDGLVGS